VASERLLGSWVLELTARGNVLQRFDGGDGTVGIHGRHTVGAGQLPGTPVEVS
jgi:hypothetical protein